MGQSQFGGCYFTVTRAWVVGCRRSRLAKVAGMAVRLKRGEGRPFVGRDRELAIAAETLADNDRAGVVLLAGESGLGKTRLTNEIVQAAPAETAVVRGGAVPRAVTIPFELVRSARSGEPDENGVPDTASMIRIEAELLRNVSEGPVIYVFEDLHWADAASLEVIERLMVAGPLDASILLTYRPNALDPGHPTSAFVRRAERRSHVVQFRLEPLRRGEVGDYLAAAGRPVESATVDHVHSRTGGNPLLVSELVAAVADDADLTHGLPWTLAEMLRPEIERLPQPERLVAEAVAVLGTDVDFDLLAAAVRLSERELLEHLRSLVENGVLVESGPDRFGFRHDLVREAVADGLFTREHRRIHATVHDALLAAGSDDLMALVAHATGAGRTKQAADAARDAARLAMEEGWSHQTLVFAEQALLEHTDDLELLRLAVVSGWRSGQIRIASHHLERWEELVGLEPMERAEVLHFRVRLHWERGDLAAADHSAEELTALAESMVDGVARVQALADLAQHHMLRSRKTDAIALADRAIAIAAEIGPEADDAALQARAERACALIGSDGGEARSAAVRELLVVAAEAEAAGNYLVASRAMHNTPIQHPAVDARAHVERWRRVSERAGVSCAGEDTYRWALLQVALLDGDREAFESQLESALEEHGDAHNINELAAVFALSEGQYGEARRAAMRMLPAAEPSHYTSAGRNGLLALTDLLDSGNVEPFKLWLIGLPAEPEAEHFALNVILTHLSEVLTAGLHSDVRAFLQRNDLVRTFEPAYSGIRSELEGTWIEADAFYADALSTGMCRTVVEQMELHLARARVAEASLRGSRRAHLEAALARMASWPGRHRDRVEAMLGNTHIGGRSTHTLTPREREVATLVTRGLTNGGIAEQLFISTKTASVHVSNILAKLDMRSRAEIAAWVSVGGLN